MDKMAIFYAKVIADKGLRDKVAGILKGKDINQATDEQLAQIGELAKSTGYDITLEEAKDYLAADAKDLSDEAHEAVAGGGNKKSSCSNGGNTDNSTNNTTNDITISITVST